jgi:hypothetical protein
MSLPTLSTGRLLLRPFSAADAREVQRLAGAPEVADTTLRWVIGRDKGRQKGDGHKRGDKDQAGDGEAVAQQAFQG